MITIEWQNESCQMHNKIRMDIPIKIITALASATVVFIECMSMAFAYEYDHDLKVK